MSGERSSCEALATKSLRICSSRTSRVTSRTSIRNCSPAGITNSASQASAPCARTTTPPDAGLAQVGGKLRVAHEVRDRDADVDLAAQAQQVRGRAVEPADLAAGRQQHDAVGQRRGQAPELAELLDDAALVELLAAIDPVDDGDDVAPDAADVRRVLVRAMAQPALQAEQVDELPGERRRPARS